MKFKLTYAVLAHSVVTLFALTVISKTNGQICDKLMKDPWRPYDVSSVAKVPGIYAIGEKRGGETKYLYVGRSNDVKRRLQEHKSQKQQDIDKRVAGKFKQHKESELRIKYVPEQRQKSKEGAYMQCMKEKIGHRPELNKREGDGCAYCARSQKKSTTQPKARESATKPKTGSKKHSSGKPSLSSSARSKVASSDRSSNSPKTPSRPPSRSSGSPKVSSGRPSSRSSASPKVSSGRPPSRSSGSPKVPSGRTSSTPSGSPKVSSGRPSSTSSGSPKVSSGRAPSRSSGSPKVSSGRPSSRSSGSPKVSSGRSSFRSSGRRK